MIIGGPVPIALNVLALVGVLFLLVRRPTKRRSVVATITILSSAPAVVSFPGAAWWRKLGTVQSS